MKSREALFFILIATVGAGSWRWVLGTGWSWQVLACWQEGFPQSGSFGPGQIKPVIMAVWGRQETARRLEKSLAGFFYPAFLIALPVAAKVGLVKVNGNTCAAYIIPAILYSERR